MMCSLGHPFGGWKNAQALLKAERWNGAIYIGCYAIECILKCYLCYIDGNKMHFMDTRFYDQFSGVRGHDLKGMFEVASMRIEKAIKLDSSGNLYLWRKRIVQLGNHTLYRYNECLGYEKQSKDILEAVKGWHDEIKYRIPEPNSRHCRARQQKGGRKRLP